ncbi:MFS transporter [Mycolicibacterium baixiangningiae]|uniref:MFS transporter n=1 Tax=Mycolicibacterium baixiangningiae TaxID=2761578 RepID=UPI0018D05B45|nr:MFS transporter [Mycolicibacterium baixiangningiae]
MTEGPSPSLVVTEEVRTRWAAVIAVAVGAFTLVISEFLPVGLLPEIASDLGVSDGQAGLMITGPGVLAAVAAPIVTVLGARLDRRTLLIGLGVILFTSNVIAVCASNFAIMIVARALLGVAVGGFWAAGVSVAPRLARPADLAKATAVISSGITIATVVSLPIGPMLASAAGWRAAFMVGAGLGLLAVLIQVVALPAMPAHSSSAVRALGAAVATTSARVGMLASAVIFFGHFAAYTYLVPYLHDAELPPQWLTVCLLAYGVAGIAGTVLAGITAGRALKATTVVVTAIMVVAILALSRVEPGTFAAVALVSLWGMAWGGVPVFTQVWMLRALGSQAEGGFALVVTASQAALAMGSLAGGLIVDHAGVRAAFAVGAVTAAVGVIATATARAPRLIED